MRVPTADRGILVAHPLFTSTLLRPCTESAACVSNWCNGVDDTSVGVDDTSVGVDDTSVGVDDTSVECNSGFDDTSFGIDDTSSS